MSESCKFNVQSSYQGFELAFSASISTSLMRSWPSPARFNVSIVNPCSRSFASMLRSVLAQRFDPVILSFFVVVFYTKL